MRILKTVKRMEAAVRASVLHLLRLLAGGSYQQRASHSLSMLKIREARVATRMPLTFNRAQAPPHLSLLNTLKLLQQQNHAQPYHAVQL